MHRAAALSMVCLGLTACGVNMRWEKPGVDEAMTSQDMASCRNAARDEAWRYYYPSSPFFGRGYWFARADTDRFVAETNLTRFCMQNKGYALVEVPKKGPEK